MFQKIETLANKAKVSNKVMEEAIFIEETYKYGSLQAKKSFVVDLVGCSEIEAEQALLALN